jgi:outer membrane lipoprotein-sorting protein
MIKLVFLCTLMISLGSLCFAQAGDKNVSSSAGGPSLGQILLKLRSSSLLTLEVEKRTHSELLGKETKAPGVIYIAAKKFRWDSQGDENSKVIYDGENIWTIQDPPKGFKIPPQITKMKLNQKSEGQVFLNSLFSDSFDKHFKIKSRTKSSSGWTFSLKPLNQSLGIQEIIIVVTERSDLRQISYVDEIQNKITVEIEKISLSTKAKSQLFKFKPPTGVQVNEL